MPLQRLFYGWYDQNRRVFLVSRYPADAPFRPAIPFETLGEVNRMLTYKRASVIWHPPLNQAQMKESRPPI
jgi:hypothetical protein